MADSSQSNYYNAQAASLAAQVANQAAQLEFQRMRFEQLELPQYRDMAAIEKEKLAFAKATEVWNQAFKEASLTGSYNGMPTAEFLLSTAQMTGLMNQPGTLNTTQQSDYTIWQNQLRGLQTRLGAATPYSDAWHALNKDIAYLRTKMGPLEQIMQGTQVQTLQAQQQQFNQQMALAGLTGIVPGTTGTGGAGASGAGSVAGGAQTMAYQQMLAELTGKFNGAPTLAAQQFQQQFGLSEAAVTGLYNGNPTQAAKEFAEQLAFQREQLAQSQAQFEQTFGLSQGELTGYYGGQATLGRETMENSQANQLLQLAASLRGPRDAFQYAKVIGGTPAGLQDVLGAMAGRYNLPSYAGGTATPEAVNLQNFVGDVQAQAQGLPTYTPTSGLWAQPAASSYQVNPPGTQAPTNAYNYQPTGDGSQMVYPPGISAPQQAGQVTSQTPLSASDLSQIGAQAMAAQPYALPAPSTWNAENWNELGDYRQQLLLGGYEAAGHDADSVLDQFKASLPGTAGPTAGKIAGLV